MRLPLSFRFTVDEEFLRARRAGPNAIAEYLKQHLRKAVGLVDATVSVEAWANDRNRTQRFQYCVDTETAVALAHHFGSPFRAETLIVDIRTVWEDGRWVPHLEAVLRVRNYPEEVGGEPIADAETWSDILGPMSEYSDQYQIVAENKLFSAVLQQLSN